MYPAERITVWPSHSPKSGPENRANEITMYNIQAMSCWGVNMT